MRLKCINWILAEVVPLEVITIVGEYPGTRLGFREPISPRLRQADLGFEGPAVGADVDKTLRVILSSRRFNHEANPEYGGWLMSLELRQRERGAAQQVHCQPKPRIAQPGPGHLLVLLIDLPADIALKVGLHDGRTGRNAPAGRMNGYSRHCTC